MALVVTTRSPVRYVPDGQDRLPEGERVAYLLRVPSRLDRARFRREVRALGARAVGQAELRDAARSAVGAMLPDDADAGVRAERLAAIDESADAWSRFFRRHDAQRERRSLGVDPAEDEARREAVEAEEDAAAIRTFDELIDLLRRHSPAVAALLADIDYWQDVSALVAVRLFLEGWENRAADFRRGADGLLPEDLLNGIPEADLRGLDGKIGELMRLSEAEAKNSASPSPGSSSPASSATGETTATN